MRMRSGLDYPECVARQYGLCIGALDTSRQVDVAIGKHRDGVSVLEKRGQTNPFLPSNFAIEERPEVHLTTRQGRRWICMVVFATSQISKIFLSADATRASRVSP